jgi:hypothetical protein
VQLEKLGLTSCWMEQPEGPVITWHWSSTKQQVTIALLKNLETKTDNFLIDNNSNLI